GNQEPHAIPPIVEANNVVGLGPRVTPAGIYHRASGQSLASSHRNLTAYLLPVELPSVQSLDRYINTIPVRQTCWTAMIDRFSSRHARASGDSGSPFPYLSCLRLGMPGLPDGWRRNGGSRARTDGEGRRRASAGDQDSNPGGIGRLRRRVFGVGCRGPDIY